MPRLRHALATISLAALLGPLSVAQGAIPSSLADDPARNCTYYPTGPPAYVPGIPPHVEYDATSRVVTVAMAFAPNAEVRDHIPFFLSTVNREPDRLKVEGPISLADATQRFGVPSSPRSLEYWVLRGTLPTPAPFAVYFDEESPGIDRTTNRPCSSSSRYIIAQATEGAERENERGPAGLLPFVKLKLPVSTETLSHVAVARPTRGRLLNPQSSVRSAIRLRSAEFRQLPADQALMNLDTRRGFDVSISTSTSSPASLEYRYTIARGDEVGVFVIQRFAWSGGDAVAVTEIRKTIAPLQSDGSWLLRVEAGHDTYVSLRIRPVPDGMIQIVDVSEGTG